MKEKLKKYSRVIVSLALVCSVIGVSKGYTEAQENAPVDNGLELNKTATKNEDGTYTINLEAYTTGTQITTEIAKPTDIILVLDQSGSMSENTQFNKIYTPAYANGIEGAGPDATGSYIKLSGSEEYTKVTKTNEIIGYIDVFIPALGISFRQPIFKWEDEFGTRYVPSMNDGSTPFPENGFTITQFYNMSLKGVGPTKLESLKSAATTFVDNVIKSNGDHRIAVVGFADGYKKDVEGEQDQEYINTELFIGSSQYRYDGLTSSTYRLAFQSTKTNVKNVKASINSLTAIGNTRADLGMDMANEILTNDPLKEETGRNKVVVMFTDGEPNSGSGASSDPTDKFLDKVVANNTIGQAKTLKESNAKVYTVGIIDSLDPSQDPAVTSTSNLNRYMQYVSANYPNALSLENSGSSGDYTAGNFLAATDSESLAKIFEKISEDISSPTLELDDKTILKDIMSEYFTTPSKIDVKTYTSALTGKVDGKFTWAPRVEVGAPIINVEIDKSNINVDGFNYKENFVAVNETTGKPRGSKLIIEFKTTKKDGFIGGSQVPTNGEKSGIYVDGDLFEAFPMPVVDVDMEYTLPSTDMSIYVGSNTNGYENLFDADVSTDGIQYILNDVMYTLDGKTNGYADIVYTLISGDREIGEYTVLAGASTGSWTKLITTVDSLTSNTNIKINAKITASKNADNHITVSEDNAIYVFTPEITVKNDVIFLGERAQLDSLITGVTWINKDTNAPLPLGDIPTLQYQFSENGTVVDKTKYTPTNDKYLSVQVWNGSTNITASSKVGTIYIQVVSGELTITKNIDTNYTKDQTINASQTFIFKIDVRDTIDGPIRETFYQTIDFSANAERTTKKLTLRDLSKGYYTVTEESDWSWKYSEDETSRFDNYEGNGMVKGVNENKSIFIGNRQYANGRLFYGSANGTFIEGTDHSYPATVGINNIIKDTNILGDSAIAKNKFSK